MSPLASDSHRPRTPARRGADRSTIAAVTALLLWLGAVPPLFAQPRAVPAEFLRQIEPPGRADAFLRPSALVADRNFDEILVADPGHNRIVIFDQHGTYRFEFTGSEYFSIPAGLAVRSDGVIYVLGSTQDGRQVFRFDFDGVFLDRLDLPRELEGTPIDIQCITLDAQDRLVVLDRVATRILVFDEEGTLVDAFPVASQVQGEARGELVAGAPTVADSRLYVPLASMGSVYVYSLDGDLVETVGYQGTNVGELNFPVAVAITGDGLMLVLDKHRFNVLCFEQDGTFLGEFGGKGTSPGWFYHPSLLAVDREDQVYIGQVFQNKVQICRIPDFIRAAHLRGRFESSDPGPEPDAGDPEQSALGR